MASCSWGLPPDNFESDETESESEKSESDLDSESDDNDPDFEPQYEGKNTIFALV